MPQFIESQSYGLIFNVIGALVIIGGIIVILRYTDKPKIYLICCMPFILLAVYFMSERVETRIDDTGIYYSLFPMQWKEKHITWDQVIVVSVTNNIMYNRYSNYYSDQYVLGNKTALLAILNNGAKVLIGTRKPDEVYDELLLLAQRHKLDYSQVRHY